VLRAAATESIRSAHFAQAEKHLLRLIRWHERHYGRDALEVAPCLGDLARLYAENNFLALAEKVYQRILAIEVRHLGSESCDLVPTLYAMAQLAHRRGLFLTAEVLARRIHSIESHIGHRSVRCWNIALLLAASARELWNKDVPLRAETLFWRSLSLQEMSAGAGHPNSIPTLFALALLRFRNGDFQGGAVLMREILAIYANRHLADDQYAAHCCVYIAVALLNSEDGRDTAIEQEQLLRRALLWFEKLRGEQRTTLSRTLQRLATVLRQSHRYSEAEELLRRSLDIYVKAKGRDIYSAAIMADLAVVLKKSGDSPGAKQLLEGAYSLARKEVGPDHHLVLSWKRWLEYMNIRWSISPYVH
jgi:tetratricopeptide (TPR) repeat protein